MEFFNRLVYIACSFVCSSHSVPGRRNNSWMDGEDPAVRARTSASTDSYPSGAWDVDSNGFPY